jgi:subtilisin family serine protease
LQGLFEFVELDHEICVDSGRSLSESGDGGESSNCRRVPNDELWPYQWGAVAIQADRAWCHTTGEGIVVAVIDTGIDTNHPDLKANLWVNEAEAFGIEGVDDDENGFVDDIHGYDFVNDKVVLLTRLLSSSTLVDFPSGTQSVCRVLWFSLVIPFGWRTVLL